MNRKEFTTTIYHLNSPVKIALVTDTHNHNMGQVISSLRDMKPEIICIAGDFVYARLPEKGLKMRHTKYAMRLLKACSKIATTFVSLGNHEWMLNSRDLNIIRRTGVNLLDNEYVHLEKGSVDLVIGGLTSAAPMAYRAYVASMNPMEMEPDVIYPPLSPRDRRLLAKEPDVRWLDEFCTQKGYKILLCHHPEYYPRYLKGREIDLILSGHAHGGQIRILGQGLYAPGQGVFPRLTSGVVDGRLVISRGLSNNTVVPRWFNEPEIVYIT